MSTVPAGSLPKAAFVGANTVNGPLPCSVSTRPAAFTAATSVVWSAEFTALATIFLAGIIGWPPTMTSAANVGDRVRAEQAMAIEASNFMTISFCVAVMRRYGASLRLDACSA
ncbi:hypothetical protein D3C81_1687320 [compost metagenome]